MGTHLTTSTLSILHDGAQNLGLALDAFSAFVGLDARPRTAINAPAASRR